MALPNTTPALYGSNVNPNGTDIKITEAMMGPVNIKETVTAGVTIENQLNNMAYNMTRLGKSPNFFNYIKNDADKDLTNKVSRFGSEEFYNIIRKDGIGHTLIKHVPEHSVFYTYFKFPWNDESIEMLNNGHLSPSKVFDLKIDYLTSWLSYTLAPTSIDTHGGNRYLKICLNSNNNEWTYFYPTPGLGFGVSSNYNLCLSVELNRDANVVDLKYNSENEYDKIGHHSSNYNPRQGGIKKDDGVIFTSSKKRTCFSDSGQEYDININNTFGKNNDIDGLTTLKKEDMFGSIDNMGNFTRKEGPITKHLKNWYNYTLDEDNDIVRNKINDTFALIFSTMETDTKYNPDMSVKETIVGVAEYTFHPLGYYIFSIWDYLIKPEIYNPDQQGRWKQFKDSSNFHNDFDRNDYRIDRDRQEVWIRIDESDMSPRGFKNFYDRLDRSFISKFAPYRLFKNINLISNEGIVGPYGPYFSREVLPSYNTTSTNWFKTELSLNVMDALYNKEHVQFDSLKKLIINNNYVPFLIPENTINIFQPTFTLANMKTETTIIKYILSQLDTFTPINSYDLMMNCLKQFEIQDKNIYIKNNGTWSIPYSNFPFMILYDIVKGYYYYSFRNFQRYSAGDYNGTSFKSVIHSILNITEDDELIFMPSNQKLIEMYNIISNLFDSNLFFLIRFNTSNAMTGGGANVNKTILNPSVNITKLKSLPGPAKSYKNKTIKTTQLKSLQAPVNLDKNVSDNIINSKISQSRAKPDSIVPMSSSVFKFIVETLEDMNFFPKGKKLELRTRQKVKPTNVKTNNRSNNKRNTNKLKRNMNNRLRNTYKKNKNKQFLNTNLTV
jgi:hypothetical protein